MKKSLFLWFFAAAVAVGALLGVDPGLYTDLEVGGEASDPDFSLGEIIEIRGSSLKKTETQSFFHAADSGQKIFPLDRILTGFDSEVLVDIGEAFWLLPNSQVKIVRPGKRTEVHLLSGSLRRMKKSVETLFFVSGTPTQETLIKKGELQTLTTLPLEGVQVESLETPVKAVKVEGINEKQIHQNFRLHQKFIEKCFISHYSSRSGKTKSGKVWLRFKIQPNGALDSPGVSRSDYEDPKFHNCLENVVARVKIKGYNGPEAQVEFPINIQLPQTATE